MDENVKSVMQKRVERTMRALEDNNIQPYFVKSRQEVAPLVQSLLKQGETVTCGGSMTLSETGVLDLLRSGEYRFLDRAAPGLTGEEIDKLHRDAFFADTYLSSTNAVTENGELYNVDGNCNRISALLFGPKSVVIVAGLQKIVRDLDEAVYRVKSIAAPANVVRLHCDTACYETGRCVSLQKKNSAMTDGCKNKGRICVNYAVHAWQRDKGRIKVILVGEELGY